MKYLVIDNGGTYIKYAVMNEASEILEKGKEPTPNHSSTAEDYFRILDNIILPRKHEVSGIAFSTPGQVDAYTGILKTAGAMIYLTGKNLTNEIKERYGLAATVDNDAKCAAMAELWSGSLQGINNGAVIVFGTGVGMGLILDGKLYRGSNFTAGEASFVITEPSKTTEFTSYLGTSCSTSALCYAFAAATGKNPQEVDGIQVFEAINEKEPHAIKVFEWFTKNIAINIYNFQSLLDLEVIALGGGISQQPILLEEVQQQLDLLFIENPFIKYGLAVKKPQIVACKHYNDSNLIGALYHHLVMNNRIYEFEEVNESIDELGKCTEEIS
jgi:predicted NBD/HSP70 family sugar kinase